MGNVIPSSALIGPISPLASFAVAISTSSASLAILGAVRQGAALSDVANVEFGQVIFFACIIAVAVVDPRERFLSIRLVAPIGSVTSTA